MVLNILLVLKLPLLVSEAVCLRVTGKPPNPVTFSGQIVIPDWREHYLRSLGYPSMAFRTLSWTCQFVEFVVIVASFNPSGPISSLILKTLTTDPSCVNKLRITSLFLAGNVFTLAGTFLRVYCYRTLGRLFTFELRIQDDHRLVTNGPYSYVRHPSYTGLILFLLGILCTQTSGSWATQCGPMRNPFIQALAGAWVLVALAVMLSLILRLDREDAMLKKAFGSSWTQWTLNVPYKIIPGLY